MAHRHKMQARARGGSAFAKGGTAGPVYAGGAGKVPREAKSEEESFRRGGTAVGKAFGGAIKGRADKRKRGGAIKAFASGGKVWSHARGGIGGHKGMADAVMKPKKEHGEMHDHTVKTANDGSNYRSGHGGKAEHQYKKGGRVAMKHGGEPEGEKGDDEECDSNRYSFGGVTTYKRGGKLQMHYVGGRGRKHRADGGRTDEPDADADDGEIKPRMAKGGGCWMAEAFKHSHGQFKAKAKKAGMSTAGYAEKEADSPHASTKTKRQANLAKIGAKYGGG